MSKVNDSVLVERNIHTKLSGLLLEGEKEFFMCPYDLLESIVDLIVNNDDEENEMVNKIIDTVYKLKQTAFNSTDWMQGIPEDMFKETIELKQVDQKLITFDVTSWTDEHKKEFVANCVKEYIKQQDKVDQEYQILWKSFQSFLLSQLSIPKSKFKSTEWKEPIKKVIQTEKQLTIKWKS